MVPHLFLWIVIDEACGACCLRRQGDARCKQCMLLPCMLTCRLRDAFAYSWCLC